MSSNALRETTPFSRKHFSYTLFSSHAKRIQLVYLLAFLLLNPTYFRERGMTYLIGKFVENKLAFSNQLLDHLVASQPT